MADIEKIKAGDELRVSVKVVAVVRRTGHIQVASDAESHFFVGPETIETAEHIPAPKVFRRGDRVRIVENRSLSAYDIGYDGIVLGRVDREPIRDLGMAASTAVEVSWPDGSVDSYQPSQLEHDEAPE